MKNIINYLKIENIKIIILQIQFWKYKFDYYIMCQTSYFMLVKRQVTFDLNKWKMLVSPYYLTKKQCKKKYNWDVK